MSQATYVIGSFLGGEISAYAQGRWDKPDYRISMKCCLNSFPVEAAPWARRPGTRHGGHTRRGAAGRVAKFDISQSAAFTMELVDGFLRFRAGPTLVVTNDTVAVTAVSTATPAVVQTAAAVNWATNDTLVFPGQSTPLLEGRQFTATKIDTTHFSIADALTGAAIDGSALGALVAGAQVQRVQELATPYTGGAWAGVRAVQAETTDILLSPGSPPQAVTVVVPSPTVGRHPIFSLAPATFNDGPYLDPFINGVRATPSAKTGIISLALDFPAYSTTKAYRAGDFVTTGGVNYVSLLDQNVNNAPGGGAPWWAASSAGAAINDGRGFLGTDVGRLVRLFSEPAAWAVGTAYAASTAAAPVIVAYNPTGLPGATIYYQALAASTGKVPGTDLTNWQIVPSGAAIWSWGKITSLTNVIDRALAGSASIGSMSGGGGLGAAFDGIFSQVAAASAELTGSGGALPAGSTVVTSGYVGKDYSGAADQKIQQAIVYPSSDAGFASGFYAVALGTVNAFVPVITFNLRGKATLPVSAADGTLLASSGAITNTTAPVTLISSDQATAWKYVWVEQITQFQVGGSSSALAYSYTTAISELSFFNPTGTGTSAGVNVEILGPPLLYTTAISTWRLGTYSDTTGWPTCGVYNDGRLYLGGAVGNRFDACVSNGILGATINFAPTDQNGAVAANNAISYTFNSNGVNKIVGMEPDLQGIVMRTQAGEWLVQAPTAGPIAPANITARNVTNHGSANVQACRTEHTTIFVQRFAEKLLEYFPDVYSGKFSAPNLADKAQHIARNKVAELAYTSAVTPIVWGRDALGALFGITYKRDSLASSQPPTFYGWHRHALGSGRTVESLCSGPSVGGDLDALTMVTNDAATGIRHVEILTDTPDELSALADTWFLDDAVAPTSTSINPAPIAGAPNGGITLNGLWHLNGKTVQVFAGGLDCGEGELGAISDFAVTNGSCFVPFGDGISWGPGRGLFTADFAATCSFVVGFTYNSDGQVLRPMTPADSGARNGPAFAKLSRGHRYGMKVVNTRGLTVGGDLTKKMYPAKFLKANGDSIPALTSYSGIIQDTLQDDYDYESGAPAWRVSRPWPAAVVMIGTNLSTADQ